MSASLLSAGKLYIFRINLLFSLCAFINSGGIPNGSYRSANESSGYFSRASKISCADLLNVLFARL